MKRKFILSMSLIVLICIGIFSFYLISTMSISDCIEYCIDNSKRGAKKFSAFSGGNTKTINNEYVRDFNDDSRYLYYVASDGDLSKPQEIFIFRQKRFFSKVFLDRYQYVASSIEVQSEASNLPIGSLQYFSRKNDNDKNSLSTLILYGANDESDIFYCEYTIKSGNTYETLKERVLGAGNPSDSWLYRIYNLGSDDSGYEKEISDIRFYDIHNNLLYEY